MEIPFKPDSTPCTLCVELAGIPVCQVQSRFRAVVPRQLQHPFSPLRCPCGEGPSDTHPHSAASRHAAAGLARIPTAPRLSCSHLLCQPGMPGRACCSGEAVPPPALLVQEGTFLFASSPEVKRHPRFVSLSGCWQTLPLSHSDPSLIFECSRFCLFVLEYSISDLRLTLESSGQ